MASGTIAKNSQPAVFRVGTASSSVSVANGDYNTGSITVSNISGYTLLQAVVGYSLNKEKMMVKRIWFTASNTIGYTVRSKYGSTQTVTVTAYVLYIRNT